MPQSEFEFRLSGRTRSPCGSTSISTNRTRAGARPACFVISGILHIRYLIADDMLILHCCLPTTHYEEVIVRDDVSEASLQCVCRLICMGHKTWTRQATPPGVRVFNNCIKKPYCPPSQINGRMWSTLHLNHCHALLLRTSHTCRIQQSGLLRPSVFPVPRQRIPVKHFLGQKRPSYLCLAATNPNARALRAEIEELQEERELALRTGGWV